MNANPDVTGQLFSEALRQTLVSVPYNSASQFLEFFSGESPPAALGASCPWQAFHAGGLVERGGGPTAVYPIDGRHVAAVYVEGDTVTILDPYLLHREPLVLTRPSGSEDGDGDVVVDAYPLRTRPDGAPAPARLRARWSSAASVRLDYVRFSPRRGHNVVSRAFELDLTRPLREVPPPADWVRPLLVHPEQNNLSVRVVDPRREALAEVVLPLAGPGAATMPDETSLLGKDNDGRVAPFGAPGFDAVMETVTTVTGTDARTVTELLLSAADVHRKHFDGSSSPMPPYEVGDE